MNLVSPVRREIRLPHAIGSLFALALAAALVTRSGEPILVGFYLAAATLALAAALRHVPRYWLLPIVSLLAFAFGAYGYATEGAGVVSIAPVAVGLFTVGRYVRARRSSSISSSISRSRSRS